MRSVVSTLDLITLNETDGGTDPEIAHTNTTAGCCAIINSPVRLYSAALDSFYQLPVKTHQASNEKDTEVQC